jgi:hypothetical protein
MRKKNLKRKPRRKPGKLPAASNVASTQHSAKLCAGAQYGEADAARETRPVRHERGRQGFALADR